jgi:hypothetical protein
LSLDRDWRLDLLTESSMGARCDNPARPRRSIPAAGLAVAYDRVMADEPAAERTPVRELPSFVGVADSGDGTLSVRVDEILYGESAAPDAAA